MSFPTPENFTGFYNVTVYMNTVTNDGFWFIMLLVVSIVGFFITYKFSNQNAGAGLTGGGLVFFVTSLFLSILNLLGGEYITIGVVLLAFGVLTLVLSRDQMI